MAIKNKHLKSIAYVDIHSGKTCYHLINLATGESVPFFSEYLKKKALSGSSFNTVKATAHDLKIFLSYLFVASEIVCEEQQIVSTPLSEIITSYPQFLLLAKSAPSKIAQRSALRLDSSTVSQATAFRMLSSVQGFIRESANYQICLNELQQLGLINTEQPQHIFAEELLNRRFMTKSEQRVLLQKSFLAGCVSGGAKYVNVSLFKVKVVNKEAEIDSEKAFPLVSILETINNANSNRDRALWALLVGTGIRVSEALNLLIEDIDGTSGEVKIIDPKTRLYKYPNYCGTSVEDISFKGRTTKKTYFLEPFKSIFIQSLKKYIDSERPLTSHSVVFVNQSNNGYGRPLYMAKNANTYNKPFKQAARRSGVEGYTIHSLRHLYGVYALNYLPTEVGFGLPVEVVQLMMGHASISSTRKYAIEDRLIIRAIISRFNESVINSGITWEGAVSNARELTPIRSFK